jgi:PKD repeat protein
MNLLPRNLEQGARAVGCAIFVIALVSGAPPSEAARPTGAPSSGPMRAGAVAATFDNSTRMDANNLDMILTNHDSFAYDPTSGPGLFYPKGSTTTVLFAGGVWVGAHVGGETRVAIGEYSQEFVPGPMLNGTFQPDMDRFRVYKIYRGDTGTLDYADWPVVDGAPTNEYGEPLYLGDVHAWSVCNDANPFVHTYTQPLGVEIKQSTYAFNQAGPLGNTIFLRFTLANKGSETLEDTYVSVWLDSDLGGYADDLIGCDTTSSLGYCYNATNADAQYGATPPAVGLVLLRGPVVQMYPGVYDTLELGSFVKYVNGGEPSTSTAAYNLMRGLHRDGTPVLEYETAGNPVTTYMVTGDPVAGAGWLDTPPGDQRMMLSMGPFTMAPGDSEVVDAAIVVGQGADRLSSITALRSAAAAVRQAYDQMESGLRISAPLQRTLDENTEVAFTVFTYNPPEGIPASLTASGVPLGATFHDNGDGTASFGWLPGYADAGTYTVAFTAQGATGSPVSATTQISVRNVNQAPVANAGGPYSGFAQSPIALDGTASVDPDGDPITFSWSFGDGTTGSGPTPSHVYTQTGLFGVAVVVSDGTASDIGTTTVSVLAVLEARAFTSPSYKTIRLNTGKPQWCVQIEPVGWSFMDVGLDPSALLLKSTGTGSADQIQAIQGKSMSLGDKDGNGIQDLTVCFSKDDLRLLFSNLTGSNTVPVTIEGDLLSGGKFEATIDVDVQAGGGSLAATVFPNPLNPTATLSFRTPRQGRLRVQLFDASGRLVRTLLDEASVPAGYHDVRIDGRSDRGTALASGVYYYRIESSAAGATGRLVIMR